MAESNFPIGCVADVMFETTYVWNRSAKETRENRTPYDLLGKGRTPEGVYIKPSRAYDVEIGAYGAVSKIEKQSKSPGISIYGGTDPLPGNSGLVCRFLRHASMWDPTGSTHCVLLYDRVTRNGRLIKRTSRNVMYEDPDAPWDRTELVRKKGAARATMPWAEHPEGQRYRCEQEQHRDVLPPPPPPPPPIVGPDQVTEAAPSFDPTPAESVQPTVPEPQEPLPTSTAVVPSRAGRNRKQTVHFSDYRQKYRSARERDEDQVGAASRTIEESDSSSEGEDRNDGRESPGGTTVEVPSAAWNVEGTNEMKIINSQLRSRREESERRSANRAPQTGVQMKAPYPHVESNGSSEDDESDGQEVGGTPLKEQLARTGGGTATRTEISTPAPGSAPAVLKVALTHAKQMAKSKVAMQEALSTGDMDGFAALVCSVAIEEVEELVAEHGELDPSCIGHSASQHVAHILGLRSVNRVKKKKNSNADLPWQPYLDHDVDGDLVKAAYESEVAGLLDTIFTELDPEDPEFAVAMDIGTRSRPILAKKRSGKYKARVVKLGHLESGEARIRDDGMYFNYSAHVIQLRNLRMILSMNMRDKRVVVIDVSQAFLQANKFEDGKFKYTYWKDKLTGQTRAFRSTGPQYGEASAPSRWLETLKEFMTSIGMVQCKNEPSAFQDMTTGLIVAARFCTHGGNDT